jgi:hypothetical protein
VAHRHQQGVESEFAMNWQAGEPADNLARKEVQDDCEGRAGSPTTQRRVR